MSKPITDHAATGGPEPARPLVLTGNDALAEHLLRICAAVGTDRG